MIGVNLNQISKKLNSNQQIKVDFLMESISNLMKNDENLVEIKKFQIIQIVELQLKALKSTSFKGL